jgi:hypothetical protein
MLIFYKYFLVATFLLLNTLGFTQSSLRKQFGRELQIGTGGLVSGDTDIGQNHFFDFYLLNTKLSISIAKRTHLGYRNFLIVQSPPNEEKLRFAIHGGYIQYDFLERDRIRLWAETGYYFGDYCSRGLSDATKRKGSNFAQIGLGSSIRLFDQFALEFSGRKGFYLPTIPNIRSGDIGFFIHYGLVYMLRLR